MSWPGTATAGIRPRMQDLFVSDRASRIHEDRGVHFGGPRSIRDQPCLVGAFTRAFGPFAIAGEEDDGLSGVATSLCNVRPRHGALATAARHAATRSFRRGLLDNLEHAPCDPAKDLVAMAVPGVRPSLGKLRFSQAQTFLKKPRNSGARPATLPGFSILPNTQDRCYQSVGDSAF
jgi:hypothetical protein